jgi:hypothetical protein
MTHVMRHHTPPTPFNPPHLTNHVQQRLLHLLPLREPAGPVVAGAASLLADEDVLRVEQVADV